MKPAIKARRKKLANRSHDQMLKSRYRRHGCMCGKHRMREQPFPFLLRVKRTSGDEK